MTASERKNILKIQANLLKISVTGNAPINIVQYENRLGLVRTVNKIFTPACGLPETVFDKLVLTEKGKRILDATF